MEKTFEWYESLMASKMIHQVNFCSLKLYFAFFFGHTNNTLCICNLFFIQITLFLWTGVRYNILRLCIDVICYVLMCIVRTPAQFVFVFFKKDLECVMGLWSIQNLWNLKIICISKINHSYSPNKFHLFFSSFTLCYNILWQIHLNGQTSGVSKV